MDIRLTTNGYEDIVDNELIENFNSVAEKLFGDDIEYIDHFYFQNVDMVHIKLKYGYGYCDFSISKNKIKIGGHSLFSEHFRLFEMMTLNDECHKGNIFETMKILY